MIFLAVRVENREDSLCFIDGNERRKDIKGQSHHVKTTLNGVGSINIKNSTFNYKLHTCQYYSQLFFFPFHCCSCSSTSLQAILKILKLPLHLVNNICVSATNFIAWGLGVNILAVNYFLQNRR